MKKYIKIKEDLEQTAKVCEFSEKDLSSKGWVDSAEVAKIDRELSAINQVLVRSQEKASVRRIG